MNAIDYLLKEHDHHRLLMDKIDTNRKVYTEFRSELVHHVNMEEVILYPGLMKIPELEVIVREAWEEHSVCMALVQELDDETLSDKLWASKFAILKKILLTHLDEEEEKLFPKVRELSSDAFLNEVGEQMEIQKEVTHTDEILYPDEPGSHKLKE